MIGRALGHFHILDKVGKGGMGEVFRAHDGKLGRDVAIKVLPDEFSRDAERLARFKREAKVLASLNHPNIAAIHGLEESDGTHYLVLELVPGETLAERIARGPIPLDEAIAIATKIAEGLEEAHEQGIVHRDLKPANVKLTPDDKVKILDFGLAKAFVDEAPAADDSLSPTITRDATRAGVILGTAAYMSPEQAKGKRVDRRADIFALGSVLYEMLTGKKAFGGDGVSDVLAAVIKDEPDWSALPAGTPFVLRRLLRRCLAKPAARRFQHVGDVRLELEEPGSEAAGVEERVDRRWSVVAAAVALAAGVAVGALVRAPAPEAKLVSRWRIALPSGTHLTESTGVSAAPALAISPDGRHVAFLATRDGRAQLYLRAAEALEPIRVESAENASRPFFSADGESLGFRSEARSLMRVSRNGGAPVPITEAWIRGASWSADGNITFSTTADGALYRVPAAGGEPELLAAPDRADGARAFWLPEVLPGGEVLVTVADLDIDSYDDAAIAAWLPESGDLRVLIRGGSRAQYSPTGHLVYGRAGALYAAPFDDDSVTMTGDPVRVLEGVATWPTTGSAEFDLAPDGSLLYAPGTPLGLDYRVVWVDRSGQVTTLVEERRPFVHPQVSPDGRSLAVGTNDANMNLWRYDVARGALTRIVTRGNNIGPVWTPDGSRIAFASDRESTYNIFSIGADGAGPARPLLDRLGSGGGHVAPLSWTPDGRSLLFVRIDARTGDDLWLLTEDGETEPFLLTPASETNAEIAPNGRWMAYQSDESGRPEIYLCEFPGGGSRQRVSINGGTEPRWNPNGGELFYREGSKLMAVDVETRGSLAWDAPRMLFESKDLTEHQYDVSADGERFVMIDTSVAKPPPTELVLVQNWAEELKRLVPVN